MDPAAADPRATPPGAAQGRHDDFAVGRTVLQQGLVSREGLLECLYQVAQERKSSSGPGFARPLGVVLVSRGLLTDAKLSEILASRLDRQTARPAGELEVGELLVAAGIMTGGDVEGCLKLQQVAREAGKPAPPLGQLAVLLGYATEEHVQRALSYQKRALFACQGCGIRANATPPPPGTRYRCKKCGGALAPVSPVAPTAGGSLREAERPEEEQIEIDRATAAYLKQKNMIRRDHLRDAQRLQMEFARYGLVVPLVELLRRAGTLTWQQQQSLQGINFAEIVRQIGWKDQAIPGYRLFDRVASGGYATIYVAESVFGGRRVAVKLLHAERSRDAAAVARFAREAALLRKLSHANIVHGTDHGEERGRPYLVMEYVDGRSLGQMLSEGGAFPLRNALSAARQIAEALRYLHSEGYLHRDIKPDNVLLDMSGQVKLCDLGFCAPIPAAAPEGQRAATVVGTKGYMAPEAARGEADAKVGTDIYALGITLYALLTGYEPFKGASSEEVVTEQIEGGLPRPNLMMVKAPPLVIQLLNRLMHPDRTRRFATVVQVLEAMDPLMTR